MWVDTRTTQRRRARRIRRSLVAMFVSGLVVLAGLPGVAYADAESPIVLGAGETATSELVARVPGDALSLDVMLVIDVTGSQSESLTAIRQRLLEAVRIADGSLSLRVGVATVGDYPVYPFGTASDQPYRLVQQLTGDASVWSAALDGLRVRLGGGDAPEAQLAAVYQAITGTGQAPYVAPGQGAAFADDATKVVVVSADSPVHEGGEVYCGSSTSCVTYPGPTSLQVQQAADDAGVAIVGLVDAGSDLGLAQLAFATGGAIRGPSLSGPAADPLQANLRADAVSIAPRV
ncbi:MAG: hypothetical protein KDB21_20025, partial [Acidimicrobiales bacterium]|nr:hypothetical protein [Acidimicrobiales bacterium]